MNIKNTFTKIIKGEPLVRREFVVITLLVGVLTLVFNALALKYWMYSTTYAKFLGLLVSYTLMICINVFSVTVFLKAYDLRLIATNPDLSNLARTGLLILALLPITGAGIFIYCCVRKGADEVQNLNSKKSKWGVVIYPLALALSVSLLRLLALTVYDPAMMKGEVATVTGKPRISYHHFLQRPEHPIHWSYFDQLNPSMKLLWSLTSRDSQGSLTESLLDMCPVQNIVQGNEFKGSNCNIDEIVKQKMFSDKKTLDMTRSSIDKLLSKKQIKMQDGMNLNQKLGRIKTFLIMAKSVLQTVESLPAGFKDINRFAPFGIYFLMGNIEIPVFIVASDVYRYQYERNIFNRMNTQIQDTEKVLFELKKEHPLHDFKMYENTMYMVQDYISFLYSKSFYRTVLTKRF